MRDCLVVLETDVGVTRRDYRRRRTGESEWLWRKEKRVREGIIRGRDRGESNYSKDKTGREDQAKHACNRVPAAERQNEGGKTKSELSLADPIVPEKHTHEAITRVEIGT